jgi:hypothetical protein
MKLITPISIWDAGQNKQADILDAFAVNVTLGLSATFYYTISNEQEQLAQGKLTLEGEDYQLWNSDTFAWGWIAAQLNLTIIGDYVPPVVEPIVEEVVPPVVEPIVEEVVPPVVEEGPTQTQPNN